MGFIADNYGVEQTTPLMTDKYHFTTAYAYWLEGRADNPSVFYMFGRKEALGGGYTVAGGLEGVIDIVKRWQEHGFSEQDIAFIRSQKTPSGKQQFPDEFIDYLKNMKFNLKIDAAPEGAVFFPQEPVIRVEGPIAQVKMLESVALGLVNGHSGYMTHAARQSDVVEKELDNGSPKGAASVQGLRRGPSLGAAIEASRSLGAGGYTSSSTGTAAKQFGQVFAGTMDHAWVMTHEKEMGDVPLAEMIRLRDEGHTAELQQALKKDAFRSFVMAHPESGILLVDTYDPLQGLEHAITVIKELREQGLGKQYGVRFDSGDIVKYSKIALRRFAEEGFVEGLTRDDVQKMDDAELLKHAHNATVFCAAADGIDEHSAKEMRDAGAFFKSWGVGTAGSHVAPLGLVYKAASVYMDVLGDKEMPEGAAMTPVMKVAAHAPVKSSNPGRINSRRFYSEDGKLSHVVLYDEALGLDANGTATNLRNFQDSRSGVSAGDGKDLLVPVFDAKGKYVYNEPPQKESFPGSGKMVTDLAAMAKSVKSQLNTLPEGVRIVARPRDEVLQKKLLAAFKTAEKSGQGALSIDVAALKASLPPEVEHIPVFLDQKLFEQRMECEQRHLAHSNRQGVGEYKERFEGGNAPFAPGSTFNGALQITGGQDRKQAIQ
jgi:nicotinate phosphoribosyltransferase